MKNTVIEQKDSQLNLKKIKTLLGVNNVGLVLANDQPVVEVISTGSYGVNQILGVGGWPRGKISEIYGAESTGKSTLAYRAIAECQQRGGVAVLVDLEGSFDPVWATKNNIDVKNLILCYPDSGEQGFMIINALVKSQMVDLIVIDSVAAMVPLAELQADLTDQMIGVHARMMGRGIRMLQATLLENPKPAILFINQIRSKMVQTYLPAFTTPGGFALRFGATIRVELKQAEVIRDVKDSLGHYVRVRVVKNKLAAPFKSTMIILSFDGGLDYDGEIIEHAINQNIIQKNGSWYLFDQQTLAQGLKNLKALLKTTPEIMDKIVSLLT